MTAIFVYLMNLLYMLMTARSFSDGIHKLNVSVFYNDTKTHAFHTRWHHFMGGYNKPDFLKYMLNQFKSTICIMPLQYTN
jgi:hypothetical protein